MSSTRDAARLLALLLTFLVFSQLALADCPTRPEFRTELRKALFDFLSNPDKAALTFTEVNSSVRLYIDDPWIGPAANTYCNVTQPQYSNVNFTEVFRKATTFIPETVVPRCSDGTFFGDCSARRPLFCAAGRLVDRCGHCGCETGTCLNMGPEIGCCSTGCIGEYKRCANNASITSLNSSDVFERCVCGESVMSGGYCCDGNWQSVPCSGGFSCLSTTQCLLLHASDLENRYYCNATMNRIMRVERSYNCVTPSCVPFVYIFPGVTCPTGQCVNGLPDCAQSSASVRITATLAGSSIVVRANVTAAMNANMLHIAEYKNGIYYTPMNYTSCMTAQACYLNQTLQKTGQPGTYKYIAFIVSGSQRYASDYSNNVTIT